MEKTLFRFERDGIGADTYIVTNFSEEKESKKSVRCYTIESSGISSRFLIENKGSRNKSNETKRSKINNTLRGYVKFATQKPFYEFFKVFSNENSDAVAAYTPIEQIEIKNEENYATRYFLVEFRGCKPLGSEGFNKESLESKALVLKSIFAMVFDISSVRIAIKGEDRKRCSLDFNSDAFYYSPLTKKAYLKDFDGINFYKQIDAVDPDITELVRFTRNSLNTGKCTKAQGDLIGKIADTSNIGRIIEILDELGKKPEQITSSKKELTTMFCHLPDEKGFNPIINYLFYEYKDEVVNDDIRLISDIEENVKSIYACTNINRLHGLVKETEAKLASLSNDFNDYKRYRYHSVNVEYAKRLAETDDLRDYLDRAKRSYNCINAINEKYVKKYDSQMNRDEDILRFKAYVSACLAESAWITCLALRKAEKGDELKNLGEGFKERRYADFNVRVSSEEAVKYYGQLYTKEKNITNAKLLATACRNRGVYLENYRIDGIPDSPDTVKEMYLKAYELMLEHGPALENHKIYHCLISFNLKLASLKRQNDPEEAIEILEKNKEYLKEMAERGFGKTESYCLLKMVNNYDLFLLLPNEINKEELDKDVMQYCVIVGEEKFDKLKDASEIKKII